MKLSIAWIFDHIDADWRTIDIPDLVARFNETTAEIEGVHKVHVDLEALHIAQMQEVHGDQVQVLINGKAAQLPVRDDLHKDHYYMVKKLDDTYAWARAYDMGGSRDILMSALAMDATELKNWRKKVEQEDYILDVDNKSITNRPDLWGHRGFAREIAAILNLQLKPFDDFLYPVEVLTFDQQAPKQDAQPWAIEVEAKSGCNRFALNYVQQIAHKPSALWMAHRLVRVDARAIDAIVDATNYTMLDTSQPMHAFDADTLHDKKVVVRRAKKGEKLTLLDEQKIELVPEDIIIADGKTPISLAGVMGGATTGIQTNTRNVLLESAHFDPAPIRHAAARYKVRTEASTRFEKNLDPNQNIYAIQRFIKLMQDMQVPMDISPVVTCVGQPVQPKTVVVPHDLIELRLGVEIAPKFVHDTLIKLTFGVQEENGIYTITIPTFRATKDIGIPEDIIEEIGRFYGYNNIPQVMPYMQLYPSDLKHLTRLRKIRHVMAYALQMRELYNYALFDESFLHELQWQPVDTAIVKDPVSENWRRLVTTLIPHMFKAVLINHVHHDALRFFEWGRVWTTDMKKITEKKQLVSIWFDKKSVDFYDGKNLIHQLFEALDLNVTWHRAAHDCAFMSQTSFFMPYQVAHLQHNDRCIGIAGKVAQDMFGQLTEGDAFICALDGDFLLQVAPEEKRYTPASKYPEVIRDISMLVPLEKTFAQLRDAVAHVDERIVSIVLIDFFEKKEWHDQKSLAFRFIIRDEDKTLTKQEVDDIYQKVVYTLEQQGATIR